MNKFVEITIGEDRFVVSSEWADAIYRMIKLASDQTLRDHEGCDIKVELRLVQINAQSKIAAIKEVRSLIGLNLAQSKQLVDSVQLGVPQRLGLFPLSECPKISKLFAEAGAKISYPSPLELLAREA